MSNKDHIYTWPSTTQLVPSVTTVIHDILRKPEIENWHEVQVIVAARQNPMLDITEVQKLAYADRNIAGSIGSWVHDCALKHHLGQEMPAEYGFDEVKTRVDAYVKWANGSYAGDLPHCEEIVYGEINGLRYAGRPDIPYVWLKAGTAGSFLDGTRKLKENDTFLLDLKTGSAPRYEWSLQLSAYQTAVAQTYGPNIRRSASVRLDDQGVHLKEHPFSMDQFAGLLVVWWDKYGARELEKRMKE